MGPSSRRWWDRSWSRSGEPGVTSTAVRALRPALPLVAVLVSACVGAAAPRGTPGDAAGASPDAALPASSATEPSATPPSAAAPPAPPAPPLRQEPSLRIEGESIRCVPDRCRGKLLWTTIAFSQIDPGATSRWGDGPDQPLYVFQVGVASGARQLRVREPPLASLLPTLTIDDLAREIPRDEVAGTVALELGFPDGERFRGEVPIPRSTVVTELRGRLEDADGPVSLPGDTPWTGAPRAMWVPSLVELRGRAESLDEIDWILRVDTVDRPRRCPHEGRMVESTVPDLRARAVERRTGKVLGTKVLPDPGAPTCALMLDAAERGHIFAYQQDRDTLRALADWAWNELRGGAHGARRAR